MQSTHTGDHLLVPTRTLPMHASMLARHGRRPFLEIFSIDLLTNIQSFPERLKKGSISDKTVTSGLFREALRTDIRKLWLVYIRP
jgi:hypothetical protein